MLYYELFIPGETVTGERYALQLNCLTEQIEEKRPYTGRRRRPVILQHDNATPHRSSVAGQTINDLQWELMLHPAYSPNIAPTNYHLFHSLQNILAEQHFKTEDEVRKVIDEFIASKDQAFCWRRGIHQLPEHWQSVVVIILVKFCVSLDFYYQQKICQKRVELFCTPILFLSEKIICSIL